MRKREEKQKAAEFQWLKVVIFGILEMYNGHVQWTKRTAYQSGK